MWSTGSGCGQPEVMTSGCHVVCNGRPLSIGGIRDQKQDREILFNQFNRKINNSVLFQVHFEQHVEEIGTASEFPQGPGQSPAWSKPQKQNQSTGRDWSPTAMMWCVLQDGSHRGG